MNQISFETPSKAGYCTLEISHTCRQLCTESSSTDYTKNIFEFRCPLLLYLFIQAIGLINAYAISNIRIVYEGDIKGYKRYSLGLRDIVTIMSYDSTSAPFRYEYTRKFRTTPPKLEIVTLFVGSFRSSVSD